MKKKLLVFGIIIGLLLALFGVDKLISMAYTIEVVQVDPSPSPADGKTPVSIRVRLTKGGAAVPEHVLYILSLGGGSFKSIREITDENGYADFIYYPYLASKYLEAGKVPIEVMDESNSIFISAPASTIFELELTAPGTSDETPTVDGIFS